MQTYTLKVVEIRQETVDTVTLCFKQPALKKVKYKAGQYLTLIFRINGRRYIRPYSFSSAPVVDSTLDVTVKRVPNGIVSNHVNDVVKVGDSIEVMSPMGDFVLPEEANYQTVFLWGAGSGITPLISIAKYLLKTDTAITVNLIYGNKTKETTIFQELIDELSKSYPKQLKVWHFHTQLKIDENIPNVIQGRIAPKKVMDVVAANTNTGSLHFICGPTGLKESVTQVLPDYALTSNSVFTEDFELVKDPKDFEDIFTQNVTLHFEKNEYKLEVAKGKSILEASLDANIELPYSCQTGNCSSCKAKLVSGQIRMIGLTKPRADLSENECLLCCAHSITENIIIEI